MSPLVEQVWDEVQGAWRFRWLAFATASVLAIAGWIVVFALPDLYAASAKVFVDTRTALKPVLQGLVVEQDVDAQLNYVRESLLNGPQLQKVAQESGILPASGLPLRQRQQILSDLSQRVSITVRGASNREDDKTGGAIYGIVYQDTDRARSLRVVRVLLDKLINETLGGKREGAENAQQFLETQIHDYEQRLRTAENRLADFKSRHIGQLPEEQGGYFTELQTEMNAVSQVKSSLAEEEARRAELLRQLHGNVVVASAVAPGAGGTATAGGAAGDTLLGRIQQTQARLDELLLKFTDKYPDVIATRQTLAELKRRRAAEIEMLKQGDAAAAAASGAGANPVYQSIELALNQANVDIAKLTSDLAQHQARAAELKQLLDTAPQVEAEYQQLNRDYDVNKAEYTKLLENYEKARLGERADDAGSVRFNVVEPPTASFQPVWPRRMLALAGVFVAALVAGGALAWGLHQLNPVVSSATALAQATGVRVLGVVTSAFPGRARRSLRVEGLRLTLGAVGLFAAFVCAVLLSFSGFRLAISSLKHLVHV